MIYEENIDDYDLLDFVSYLRTALPYGLPTLVRAGLISLLVDSESDIIEHSSRTELEHIVRYGSKVIGVANFDDKQLIECCFEEDIPCRYSGEIDGIIRSGMSNIEYASYFKQWLESRKLYDTESISSLSR
jgi:hypothetical protein